MSEHELQLKYYSLDVSSLLLCQRFSFANVDLGHFFTCSWLRDNIGNLW